MRNKKTYLNSKILLVFFISTAVVSISTIVFAVSITFSEQTIDNSFTGVRDTFPVDVDGDGDMDVLGAASSTNDNISWWENDGSESFTKHIVSSNFAGASAVYAIDVDSDGDIDFLGSADVANDIIWWENNGSEVFTEHIIDSNFAGANSVYAIDVDSDGDIDVVAAASIASQIAWWENDGSEVFTKRIIGSSFLTGHSSAYAMDMDGDGDIDVLGVSYTKNDLYWWENDGSEVFTENVIDANFVGARTIRSFDVDGDGDIDIIGAGSYYLEGNPTVDEISWWDNDGSQTFTKYILDTSFTVPTGAYAKDMDGDGDIDILGSASTDNIAWWDNDGSETFTKRTVATTVSGVKVAYPVDIDGDGNMDILAASYSSNSVVWMKNATADVTAPTVTFDPLDSATGVAENSNITITFNEAIRNIDDSAINDTNVDALITLKDTDNSGSSIGFDATINAGKTVITINPTSDFSALQVVYVAIGSTVEDAYNNAISSANSTFTNGDSTNPTVSSFSPLDDATNVGIDSNIVITFTESVDAVSGDIVLYKVSDDSIVQTFDVLSDISGSGSDTITLNPTSDLDYEVEYYINIDAIAFDDTSGNSYAGISDTATFSFTTESTPSCPIIDNASTYNAYPTCGVSTCSSGYTLTSGACAASSGGYIHIRPPSVGSGVIDKFVPMYKTKVVGKVKSGGSNVLAYIGSNVNFDVISSISGSMQNFDIKISDLNTLEKIIKVKFLQNQKIEEIKEGGWLQIDMDGDNINDIKITFNKLLVNRIDITIEQLGFSKKVCSIEFSEGVLLKTPYSTAVYITNKNKKCPFFNSKAFLGNNFKWDSIKIVNDLSDMTTEGTIYYTEDKNGNIMEDSNYMFSNNLWIGTSSLNVKKLQEYLNRNGFSLTSTGPGSPNNETNFFGRLTRLALIRFQKANNIEPSIGFFGEITRGIINRIR